MASLQLSIPCTAGGSTEIKLNFESKRSGSSNDNCAFRVVRRGGAGEVALSGEPNFVLTADKDVRGWTWIDVGTPTDDTYTYQLQIRRNDGGGTFYAMTFIGVHYAK